MRNAVVLLAGAVAFATAAPAPPPARSDIRPPTGYRSWFHVNSSLVDTGSALFPVLGGLHNIYINSVGQPALETGGLYPAGTVFVDDIHNVTIQDHVFSEAGRKGLAVMVKDVKQYSATGGWGFQLWAAGDSTKPIVTNAALQCFGCHAPHKDHQYVFSTYIP